ncbi:hypothetical protein M1N47_03665 [Dehalococcoidia bacterium]|nr:hypothetical protein [Dehalococcoidia bacterium]
MAQHEVVITDMSCTSAGTVEDAIKEFDQTQNIIVSDASHIGLIRIGPEGAEHDLTREVFDMFVGRKIDLPSYDLGEIKGRLSRREIYEDL